MVAKQFKCFEMFVIALLVTLPASSRSRVIVKSNEAFVTPNTTYVISSEIDLKNTRISIPSNCTIIFGKKGRILNGSLEGTDTRLKRVRKNSIGVEISGSWLLTEIKDSFFDQTLLSDNQILDNISQLLSENIDNRVFIDKKEYRVKLSSQHKYALMLKSKTRINIKSRIVLETNNLPHYAIVYISKADNIYLNGGVFVGDVGSHTYREGNSSQWGFGIAIITSSNVTINNVHVSKCIGDGIYIGGGEGELGDYTEASKAVFLNNVISEDNRRQGISITYADGVSINNCIFKDTGKTEFISPGCGLVIEPNEGQSVRNVNVRNCQFLNNDKVLNVSIGGYQVKGALCNVEKIRFENCQVSGYLSIRTGSVQLEKCSLVALSIHLATMPKEKVLIKNTKIRGGAGVRIRTVGELAKGEYAPKYEFVNCEISSGPKSEYALFGTLNHKGNEQMATLTFKDCQLELSKGNERYRLIQAGCVCDFVFDSCVFLPHGRTIDLSSVRTNDCTIIAE